MSQRAEYETLASRDAATFNNTYQTLGSPSVNPTVILKIVNNTTVLITVSKDGVTAHDVIPAGSFYLYDLRTNHGNDFNFAFSARTQWYVNASAGTGNVYLVRIYDF